MLSYMMRSIYLVCGCDVVILLIRLIHLRVNVGLVVLMCVLWNLMLMLIMACSCVSRHHMRRVQLWSQHVGGWMLGVLQKHMRRDWSLKHELLGCCCLTWVDPLVWVRLPVWTQRVLLSKHEKLLWVYTLGWICGCHYTMGKLRPLCKLHRLHFPMAWLVYMMPRVSMSWRRKDSSGIIWISISTAIDTV